jgi:hypothetical protein
LPCVESSLHDSGMRLRAFARVQGGSLCEPGRMLGLCGCNGGSSCCGWVMIKEVARECEVLITHAVFSHRKPGLGSAQARRIEQCSEDLGCCTVISCA